MSHGATWPRRSFELSEGRLVHAEREIESSFGDVVSIVKKRKSLVKFGRNSDLTANTKETIWEVGGNETYLTANLIDSVSSSSTLDVSHVTVEGHTVSGTGENAQFTFVTQIVQLNGRNRVTLVTPLARTSKVYNSNSVDLLGSVYIYENTAIVDGVPTDTTKIHNLISAGLQQSFKAATTFSNTDYAILTSGFGSVSNKQAAFVDFFLEVKQPGGVFRQQAAVSASSSGGAWSLELNPCVIIPKNSDIKVTAISSASGAEAYVTFSAYLAEVVD